MLDYQLKRKIYFQINTYLDLVGIKQKENLHTLQIKAIREVISKVVTKMTGSTRLSLILEMSTSTSTRLTRW